MAVNGASLGCDEEFASATDAQQRSPQPRGAAAAEAPGGVPSNTPPSITKDYECLGGEDWLELSLYLDHRDFRQLKGRLDSARDAAESNIPGPDEVEIAGRKFLMQPSAALVGSENNKLAYRWRLRSEDGWWLLLMNRECSHETMPTGIVRASSLPLLRLGAVGFLQQLDETLRALGIHMIREKLSRVDPCVDLKQTSVDPLYQAFSQGHHVTRARKSTNHIVEENFEGHRIGRHSTGFDFGRGNVRLRVYDKFRECRHDFETLLLMQTRRWGALGGPSALRVEFQLRREKLKALGVDSIDDWWSKRGSVVNYLTHQWCRITEGEVDPRHPDRAKTHSDWIRVQGAFAEWAGKQLVELEPLPRLPIRADHLLQQTIGTLMSYHARVGNLIDSNESVIDESVAALWDFIESRDMPMEVYRRSTENGTSPR